MRHRMVVAALALAGVLLSTYLTMYHYGMVGPLVCGASESCEKVQLSRYAMFLGVPVAVLGLGGYALLLVVALAGLEGRFAAGPHVTRLLALISGGGVAFSIYLTYLELFRIHAVCRWCVGSAVVITAIFVASLAGLRRA
ncbi:MAG: vitamin K epoxide reductase family protein [Gemmatimonadales bacterium]